MYVYLLQPIKNKEMNKNAHPSLNSVINELIKWSKKDYSGPTNLSCPYYQLLKDPEVFSFDSPDLAIQFDLGNYNPYCFALTIKKPNKEWGLKNLPDAEDTLLKLGYRIAQTYKDWADDYDCLDMEVKVKWPNPIDSMVITLLVTWKLYR
jgi:hypothetical protein